MAGGAALEASLSQQAELYDKAVQVGLQVRASMRLPPARVRGEGD
jgi:hypothetical protein